MPRITDYESRKNEILQAVIELYVTSAQPVSSSGLLQVLRMHLSSATVRNVLSDLEEMGLLSHPHTSAGRVPTDEGYRFYISSLLKKEKLIPRERKFIDRIYELKVRELDDLLFETSKLISDFTHYAGLVYFHEKGDKVYSQGMRYILEHPEFSDVRKARSVLEAMEKTDDLLEVLKESFPEKTNVYIGKESNFPQMEYCSIVVSRYEGRDDRSGRLALIGPKRMAYEKVIPLMDYVAEVLTGAIDQF